MDAYMVVSVLCLHPNHRLADVFDEIKGIKDRLPISLESIAFSNACLIEFITFVPRL